MLPSSRWTLPKHLTLSCVPSSHVNCPSSTFRMLSTTSSSAFLEDQSHVTRYAGRAGFWFRSIILRRGGFRHTNVHPLHQANSIVKYADDTYLVVTASARYTVSAELEFISSWASLNNLRHNRLPASLKR